MSGHLSGATSCFFGYVGTTSTSLCGSTCIAIVGFSSVYAPFDVFPERTPRTHACAPGVSCRSTSTGMYSHIFISNTATPPAPSSTSIVSVAGVLCPHPFREGGGFKYDATRPPASTAVPICIPSRQRANSWYFRG